MPLLAEEILDLTIEDLINDFGGEFTLQEYWWGQEFTLTVGGRCLYAYPADCSLNDFEVDLYFNDELLERPIA